MRTTFNVALGLALVHALDDAFLHRQPGVDASTHALAAVLAAVFAAAALVLFGRLRPGLQAAMALAYGALALTNGALHAKHVADSGASASDITGLLAVGAGATLVSVGVAAVWRGRGSRPHAWRNRAIAAIGGGALALLGVMPVAVAITKTHKFRESVGTPPSSEYRAVAFDSTDGLRLRGWYHPSRNGAAVLIVHGGGGDRTGGLAHARMLVRHGYGVLVYDSRGRGESDGSPNAYGWRWDRDVAGALRFLESQPDVERGVAGLGLSTGADVLLEVAGRDRRLRALVSDGATGRSSADLQVVDPITKVSFHVLFAAARVFSGTPQPSEPLEDVVPRVAPTPLLLVSATRGPERDFNRLYGAAARGPAELWDLPDVHHTAAVRERAAEYERRVVGLFDRALLAR